MCEGFPLYLESILNRIHVATNIKVDREASFHMGAPTQLKQRWHCLVHTPTQSHTVTQSRASL